MQENNEVSNKSLEQCSENIINENDSNVSKETFTNDIFFWTPKATDMSTQTT